MATKKYPKKKQAILNSIPIFLSKTYQMVDNPEFTDIICWSSNGDSFIIKDIAKLTTDILQKYFKHNNFASFVRQLNMYGFKKVRSQTEEHIFEHEFFNRDRIQLLTQIKRKNSIGNSNPNRQQQSINSQMVVAVQNNNPRKSSIGFTSREQELEKEIFKLANKHTDLENIVSILIEQNKQIIMQNRQFVMKMNKMDQKYRKKLQTLIWMMLFGRQSGEKGFSLHGQNSKMIQPTIKIQPNKNNALQLFKAKKKNKKEMVDEFLSKILKSQEQNQVSESQIDNDCSFESLLKRIQSTKDDKPPIMFEKSVKGQNENQNEYNINSDDQFLPPICTPIPASPICSNVADKQELSDMLDKFNNEENSQFSIGK